MELEAEVARLRAELARPAAQAAEEVERTHRQYRRDLVPVKNSPERWQPPPDGDVARSPISKVDK